MENSGNTTEVNIGNRYQGEVVALVDGGAITVFGDNYQGFIPVSEISWNYDLTPFDGVAVGEEVEVIVIGFDSHDRPFLSIKNLLPDPWDGVEEKFPVDSIIDGIVHYVLDYTAVIDIGDQIMGRVYPENLSWDGTKRPADLLDPGDDVKVKVLSVDLEKRCIKLGIRELQPDPLLTFAESHLVGSVIEGNLRKVLKTGALRVDVEPGITGFVHRLEVDWNHFMHPHHYISVGDRLELKLLSINMETRKLHLSRKQMTDNPWDDIRKHLPIGSIVCGSVIFVSKHSVRVKFNASYCGYVKTEDLDWDRHKCKSDFYQKGDESDFMILAINQSHKMIQLGRKQAMPDPWQGIAKKYSSGTITTGTIDKVLRWGAFVELESGVRGLLHKSDVSWVDNIDDAHELLSEGEEIEVIVLSLDLEDRKLQLGHKQLTSKPWDAFTAKNRVGDTVIGVIQGVKVYGAFVEISEGIRGLLHRADIPKHINSDMTVLLQRGDKLRVIIDVIDQEEERIGLKIESDLQDTIVQRSKPV